MAGENRILKEKVCAEIKEKLEKATCITLVDYNKITVSQVNKLRNELRAEGVEYKVYKNRLVARVMTELGYGDIVKELEGMIALVISYSDVVAPSRVIMANAKAINKLDIKGGIVEGKIYNKEEMEKLAKIPSKEVLIGQLLGLLTNPARSLAVVISEVAKQKAA